MVKFNTIYNAECISFFEINVCNISVKILPFKHRRYKVKTIALKMKKNLDYYNHITYAPAFGFSGYVVFEAYWKT